MNFISARRSILAVFAASLSVALFMSTVRAQKPSPEQKPDVSTKALITKQTPDPSARVRGEWGGEAVHD